MPAKKRSAIKANHLEVHRSSLLGKLISRRVKEKKDSSKTQFQGVTNLPAFFRMLISLMAVFWYALFSFLNHHKEVLGEKLDSGLACKDNREEFGFALVGHDFRSLQADNFVRCYFECSLEERCQSVTFLWNEKECQMKKETKKSRPGDFVENPAATYMENNVRGLSVQLF